MPKQNDKVYQFAPLDKYTFDKRLTIRLADLAFYYLILIVGTTIRFKTENKEHLESIVSSGHQPIYASWHDRIFLGTYYLRGRGITFLTSQSFDGEYIARFIQRLGYGAIRGSSTKGGSRALIEMIRKQKLGIPMGFTVDGPKGPRHVAKLGPVMVAKKTGDPILPFIITPKRSITANSWDKMIIPMPFTRATMTYGEPIFVPDDADDTVIKEKLAELQASLDELVERSRS
ncbi:MAG: lysophospholipid acyltransferase family protein [Pyrinomonadaceae bacterium]|nr:lysophospholipid acyltransferase family protein [Chloracidobacterium sp.]